MYYMNDRELQEFIKQYHIKNLTMDEIKIIIGNSKDPEFIKIIDNYKKNKPDKFQSEINRLGKPMSDKERAIRFSNDNIPKCPTCGSTNVHKISATKRWLTTGLFGLGSSDATHTYVCENCKYKW